jgi:hypothetical protein
MALQAGLSLACVLPAWPDLSVTTEPFLVKALDFLCTVRPEESSGLTVQSFTASDFWDNSQQSLLKKMEQAPLLLLYPSRFTGRED